VACEARPTEPGLGATGSGHAPCGAPEVERPRERDAVREAGPVAGKRTTLVELVDSRPGEGWRSRTGRALHGMRGGWTALRRQQADVCWCGDGGTGSRGWL